MKTEVVEAGHRWEELQGAPDLYDHLPPRERSLNWYEAWMDHFRAKNIPFALVKVNGGGRVKRSLWIRHVPLATSSKDHSCSVSPIPEVLR